MDFVTGLHLLAALDLTPAIVDGKVVIHGDQSLITPEIEAWAKKHLATLRNHILVEADAFGPPPDDITEIGPEPRYGR